MSTRAAPATASEGVTDQHPSESGYVPNAMGNPAYPAIPTRTDEIPERVKALNMLDPYFYSQFVLLNSFSWSNQDQKNKILWSIELKPENMHANLAYITAMYNAWVGDFEFMLKIAGTGFHGGALGVAWIPPNLNVEDLSGAELTIFDYLLLDPKMQDLKGFAGKDVKNVDFHWKDNEAAAQFNSDFAKVASKGGYLVMFVVLPLITSTTGNNAINLAIFNRVAPTFRVGQMIPIKYVKPSPALFHDPFLDFSMGVNLRNYINFGFFKQIRIEPVTIMTTDQFRDLNLSFKNMTIVDRSATSIRQVTDNGDISFTYVRSNGVPNPEKIAKGITASQNLVAVEWKSSANDYEVEVANVAGGRIGQVHDAVITYGALYQSDASWFPNFTNSGGFLTITNGLDESLVTFCGQSASNAGFTLPGTVVEMLQRGMFKGIPDGQDVVYDIVDIPTDLVTRQIRLTEIDGSVFFTTNKTDQPIILEASKSKFVFSEFIGRETPLTAPAAEMKRNLEIVLQRDRLAKIEQAMAESQM
ncbi:hypothetical protein 2 [Beihai picorna-like virus 120]|uniref:hypothetical protein 2 n=1 Tax=Beihai picorna-like virus 120 TaxID=1922549 RepID=UPI00090C8130|nr:hypothetical protein 2 [Beihai picorna-like virus 120]APG76874.1 hypothetical protein 2 [Beihai picorna-like virus 120]